MQAQVSFKYFYGSASGPTPKPIEYSTAVLSEAGGVGSPWWTKNMSRACALQWAGVKQSSNKSLVKVIDKEGIYFRPYIYTSWGFTESISSRKSATR